MSEPRERTLIISATFTAEPVEAALSSWCKALELDVTIQFAPFNQVFPQLLDPQSELSCNPGGLNVILFRTEDLDAGGDTASEFIGAVDASAARCPSPILVVGCPSEKASDWAGFEEHWADQGRVTFLSANGLLAEYPVQEPLDPRGDGSAAIPYSEEFFAALGSGIARHARLRFTPPTKVIVLDCDNTLWGGACAERGAEGVGVTPGHRAFHRALLDQQRAGVLLAVCSKNVPVDVHQTFDTRDDIEIDREKHIVAERINWNPKSQNIAALAEELNLGLDSFVFIDDNPVECAEVRATLPGVLAVEAPPDPADYPDFIAHLWPLDRSGATREDSERTALYQRESKRQQARTEAPSFAAFLDSLELEIDLGNAADADLPRLAQLTARTNQFNANPKPHTEAELRERLENGDCLLAARVRDRFGDYGLVGAVFGRESGDGGLDIDGFFLSCRVLGRGVEHQLLNRLAAEREIRIASVETERNEPVRRFLDSVPVAGKDGGTYLVPAGVKVQPERSDASPANKSKPTSTARADRMATLARTPHELNTAAKVLAWVKSQRRRRPDISAPFSIPRPGLERDLATIWEDVLGIETVGALDPFSDLGGRSLGLAMVQAKLAADLGYEIPLEELFGKPTVRALAEQLEHGDTATRDIRDLREAYRESPDIAVVGMSLRVPGASNPEEFWANLKDGVESIVRLSDEQLAAAGVDLAAAKRDPNYIPAKGILPAIDHFDAAFFGVLPKDAEIMDPQQRLFLELAHEALERAGYDTSRYAGKIGVYAGAYLDTYLIANICRDGDYLDKWIPSIQVGALGTELGNDKDYLATRVAYKLDLRGPSMTLQTACSTSLVAIAQACQALVTNQTDMALAGGVTITVPQDKGYTYQEGGILSPDGHCRAFDHRAAGTVFSNGGGAVLLKRLDDAIADGDHIYSVIKGFALNNDGGEKHSYTAPSIDGQADVIAMAQKMAGVDPDTITCIEAHGTGTSLGDPIEVAGLTKAFRQGTDGTQFCALGSAKPNLGHLDVASGVTAVNKISLALQHGQIPPLINYEQPNPNIDFEASPFYIPTSLTDWQPAEGSPRRAGVSSFGVGGTNAHVVMEEAPQRRLLPSTRGQFLFPVSAKTKTALEQASTNLSGWLKHQRGTAPEDIAFTLQVGRKAHAHRRFVVAASTEEAAGLLAKSGRCSETKTLDPPVAFLFPGQGAQKVNMARELYATEPFFREQINTCAELLKTEIGHDIRDVIFPPEGTDLDRAAEALKQTVVAQPAIFVIENSLARLWMHWGVRPSLMVGHSVGEFAAACIAGVFTLEEGLRTLAARGRLMGELPRGGMLSARCPESTLLPYLAGAKQVDLGAVNGAELCVAAGPDDALADLASRLEADGIATKPLHTSHAFHSWMMDPVIDPFTEVLEGIDLKAPRIPIFSTVTEAVLGEAEATDPTYWARHLRNPVRFHSALEHLWSKADHVLLEVGPGNTLATLARQNPDRSAKQSVFASSAHAASEESDAAAFLGALGGLWATGVTVDWDGFHAYERRGRVPLPTYPFERKRFWKAAPGEGAALPALDQPLPSTPAPVTSTTMSTPTPDRTAQLESCIKEELAELSGFDPADLDREASFLELGFDSLMLTQVSKAFEGAFGVKVTLRDLLDEHPSISTMASFLDTQVDPAKFAPAAPAPEAAPTEPPAPAQQPPAPIPTAVQAAPMPQQVPMPMWPQSQMPMMPMQGYDPTGGQLAALAQQVQSLTQTVAALANAGAPAPPLATPAPTPEAQPVPTPAPTPEAARAVAEATPPATGPGLKIDRSVDTSLTDKQRSHIADLVDRYTRKTARSKELTQRYRHCYADPRTASGFNRLWKEMCYQIVVEESKGSRLLDCDGNEYIDMLNGFGPGFLGHSPDFVTEALHSQIDKGFEVGPQSPIAGEAAELFCKLTGNARASFVCTGSEAVQAAMRLSRTVTGRDKIVVFAKDYHGNFDEVLVRGVGTGTRSRSLPSAPGIPNDAVENILVLPYGSQEALDVIRAQADQLAAVLVEPIQSRRPELQPREFLHEVRDITAKSGTVLVFDEVITGFRTGPGGAQAWYGVEADLATYGKVVGGGMPIGVVAGKAEFMDTFDGGMWQYGDSSFPEKPVSFFAGTFVRHPLAMAAAKATLEFLTKAEPTLWDGLRAKADRLATTVDSFFADHGFPVRMPNFGSQMFVRVDDNEKYGNLLFYHLREKGVFILDSFPSYMTLAHTDADVDYVIDAFKESALELQDAGFFASSKPAGKLAPTLMSGPPRKLDGQVLNQPVASAGERESLPTTEAQKEILLASRNGAEASCAFNEAVAFRFKGQLDTGALEEALNTVLSRHDALRARFPGSGEEFVIADEEQIELPVEDLSDLDVSEREAALEAAAESEATTTFDLEDGPLVRARLFKVGDSEHLLLLTAHHIVCDGWSFNVIYNELGDLYSDVDLDEAPEFGEYARAKAREKHSAKQSESRDYWLGKHEGVVVESGIPTDRPRPNHPTFKSASEPAKIGAELVDALKRTGAKHGATLYASIVAGFETLLHRISGDSRITLNIPAADQQDAGWENLVGHCVGFLPLSSNASDGQTFADKLHDAKTSIVEAFEHRAFGFGEIVRELAGTGREPRPEFVLNLEHMGEGTHFRGIEVDIQEGERRFSNFTLFVNILQTEDGLEACWNYNSDLFDASTIRRWIGNFETLLTAAATDPGTEVLALPLLPPREERRVLEDWSGAGRGTKPTTTIHDLFADQVAKTPDAPVLVADDGRMSFRQADELSDAAAARLIAAGVKPGDRVAVFLERSPGLVLSLLGILKAGAAYVPVDPDYPTERIALMLEKTSARSLVTTSNLVDRLPPAEAVLIADEADFFSPPQTPFRAYEGSPDDLAYVIFTSGSTGEPKGVAVPHRGVVRLVRDTDYADLGPEQVYLASAALSFDASTFEIWAPLLNGGTLAMLPPGAPTPAQIADSIERHGVTTLWLTAGLFQLMIDERPEALVSVKQLLSGGDVLPVGHVRKALRCLPETRLINAYGPTENTTFTTCHRITAADLDGAAIPIGTPIRGTSVYILDRRLQPVPVGTPGELFTGGDGLALGYLDDPKRTNDAFVDHPRFGRLYRTGDLCRFRADGVIEFIGRRDGQVKIRGFRIERGEIENAISALPGVARCAVGVRGEAADEKTLAAYVVADGELGDLRALLTKQLPPYLVPETFTQLDALPLNPSGKIDYKALPEPESDPVTANEYAPPVDEIEGQLQELWQELLEKPRVGVEDDFFAIGGHSLLGLRMLTRLEQQYDQRLPLGALAEAPTIRGLSRRLTGSTEHSTDGKPYVFAIQEGDKSQPPLFAIHGGDGGALFYRNLLPHLDPSVPLFAVESPLLRLATLDHVPETIAEIARDYIEEIRPTARGRYRLSGYSFGGTIAYEMARQLREAGEEVEFLGLFDTSNLAVAPRPYTVAERLAQNWKTNDGGLAEKLGALGGRVATGLAERKRRNAAIAEARALLGQQIAAEDEELRRVQVNEISERLMADFDPKPYAGPMVLFKAQVPDDKFAFTELLGWEDLAEGGCEVIDVPGQHLTLFEEKNAEAMARAIEGALTLPVGTNSVW